MRTPKITRSARMLLAGAAAVTTVLAPVGTALAAPAETAAVAAGTTNCGTVAGPFDAHVNVASRGAGGRVVLLVTGRVFDEDYADLATGYQPGDRVWIDKRPVNASSWTQCGPFNSSVSHEIPNGNGTQTRACFDYKVGSGRSAAYCTIWYNGHNGSS